MINKFRSFYKNMPIKNKLLSLFIVQITIPLLFIGYSSFKKASEIIKSKSINYSQDILQMIDLRFNDLSTNMEGLTLELLYDNRVYSVLTSDTADSLQQFEESMEIRNILRQSVLSKNEISSLCLYTQNGVAFSFDSGAAKSKIEEIIPYKEVLEEARRGRGNLVWYLDIKDDEEKNIYVARTIYDRDSYEEIGMMAIILKKEYLQSVYEDLSKESSNNISILSENNEEIMKSGKDSTLVLTSFYHMDIKDGKGYYIDKKNNVLVSYLILENPNWKIIYHIPLKDLYKEIDNLKRWVILIGLYGCLLLSILSVLTSRDIVMPVNNLVGEMKKMEKGGQRKELMVDRGDEIGYLSDTFNRMSSKIDYLVNQIYREELSLKEVEIKALQAQIDPHFLFNTLENINWMAQLNGVVEISETVTALANLMDAKIGRGDKMVPLEEELEYIDNYMTVLKHRYEDSLQLIKNVNNSLLDVKIPRLLIQPIIENSIKHGVGKTPRKGIIELNIFETVNGMRIEVIDNGLGMTEEQLDKLSILLKANKLSPHRNLYEAPGKSIGLENVNRRIELIYGKKYGMKIESSFDKFTKVMMDIPKENPEEAVKHV